MAALPATAELAAGLPNTPRHCSAAELTAGLPATPRPAAGLWYAAGRGVVWLAAAVSPHTRTPAWDVAVAAQGQAD